MMAIVDKPAENVDVTSPIYRLACLFKELIEEDERNGGILLKDIEESK